MATNKETPRKQEQTAAPDSSGMQRPDGTQRPGTDPNPASTLPDPIPGVDRQQTPGVDSPPAEGYSGDNWKVEKESGDKK